MAGSARAATNPARSATAVSNAIWSSSTSNTLSVLPASRAHRGNGDTANRLSTP